MNRRIFIVGMLTWGGTVAMATKLFANNPQVKSEIQKIIKTENTWRGDLTPEQYTILRQEGTERAFSSPLNNEKREGLYVCAGCGLELFTSDMKFDSKTGWPSFFTSIKEHLETRVDYKLIYSRTEYHCIRCAGHQGHVFNDGPEPTGKRWCNNGLALRFIPNESD